MPFVSEQEYDLLKARSEKLSEVAADLEIVKNTLSGFVTRFNLQDLLNEGKMPSKMKLMSRMGGVLSEVMMSGDSLDDLFSNEFFEVLKKYAK